MFRTAKTDSPVFSEFTVFRFGKSLAYCRQGHGESQNQQAKAYIDLAALHVLAVVSCGLVSWVLGWVGNVWRIDFKQQKKQVSVAYFRRCKNIVCIMACNWNFMGRLRNRSEKSRNMRTKIEYCLLTLFTITVGCWITGLLPGNSLLSA